MFAMFIPAAKAWLSANWKVLAIVVGLLAVYIYHKVEVNRAWHAGRTELKESQKKEAERRDQNAIEADRNARDCARDPACLLRNDGHRRD